MGLITFLIMKVPQHTVRENRVPHFVKCFSTSKNVNRYKMTNLT